MAKVLLVEDDLNLQEIYGARLGAEGHSVEVASDGEAALAKAVQFKPDVLLLDIMMPKISGFDVLDIIRQTPEVRDTKVVILTALGQDSDKERGQKLGADKYLVKSQITLEDVVTAVREVAGETGGPKPASDKGTDDQSSDDTGKAQQPPAAINQSLPNQEADLDAQQNAALKKATEQLDKAKKTQPQPKTETSGNTPNDTPPPTTPGTTVTPQK